MIQIPPPAWEMYAYQRERNGNNGPETFYMCFGTQRWVEFHGLEYPLVAVTLTEDPEGQYLGWIPKDKDEPTMIQPKKLFNMQFPYGVQAEITAGRGKAIRLRVDEVNA